MALHDFLGAISKIMTNHDVYEIVKVSKNTRFCMDDNSICIIISNTAKGIIMHTCVNANIKHKGSAIQIILRKQLSPFQAEYP